MIKTFTNGRISITKEYKKRFINITEDEIKYGKGQRWSDDYIISNHVDNEFPGFEYIKYSEPLYRMAMYPTVLLVPGRCAIYIEVIQKSI